MSIAGGSDLGLFEINGPPRWCRTPHPGNIIFGTVIDDSLGDEVRVTVIAAGFEAGSASHQAGHVDLGAAAAIASARAGAVNQAVTSSVFGARRGGQRAPPAAPRSGRWWR